MELRIKLTAAVVCIRRYDEIADHRSWIGYPGAPLYRHTVPASCNAALTAWRCASSSRSSPPTSACTDTDFRTDSVRSYSEQGLALSFPIRSKPVRTLTRTQELAYVLYSVRRAPSRMASNAYVGDHYVQSRKTTPLHDLYLPLGGSVLWSK